jgi:hypothetical protein
MVDPPEIVHAFLALSLSADRNPPSNSERQWIVEPVGEGFAKSTEIETNLLYSRITTMEKCGYQTLD